MSVLDKLKTLVRKESEEIDINEPLDILLEADPEAENQTTYITREEALGLSSVYSNVEMISDIISTLEIKLYRDMGTSVEAVEGDIRTTLLNEDTNNYMTGDTLKKAIVRDYLLEGIFYIYANGIGPNMKSLNYVQTQYISTIWNGDVLFPEYKLYVHGTEYPISRFVICTKNTDDGMTGKGLIQEVQSSLSKLVANSSFTDSMLASGGVNRGVLQSEDRLSKEAIKELKASWARLYAGNNDAIVLNKGITFKEIQQSSNDLQVFENKEHLDTDIKNIVMPSLDLGTSRTFDDAWSMLVNISIMPILRKIEKALNRTLLMTEEKKNMYFAFDTKHLNRGDIEKRYKAYEIAIKNAIMTPYEVRYEEDMPSNEHFNFLKLGLADVLMNTDTGEIYTPNTNATASIEEGATDSENNEEVNDMEGGDEDENRDQE